MDDLLGLESEISAIQAGIQQIDKITPNPPMSFQTESMMPLSLGGAPQVTQLPGLQVLPPAQAPVAEAATPPRRPVAVMSQVPAGRTENYGMAPFLPPPPSKPGRRPEPPQVAPGGYSVFGPGVTAFDSIIPPPADSLDAPGWRPSAGSPPAGPAGGEFMAPPSTAGVFPMDSSSLFTSSAAPSPMPGMPGMAPLQDQVSRLDIIAARVCGHLYDSRLTVMCAGGSQELWQPGPRLPLHRP